MRNFILKYRQFMQDRYGRVDTLNASLLIFTALANIIFSFFAPVVRIIGALLQLSAFGFAVFRFLSKNIWVREKENRNFRRFFMIIHDGFTNISIRKKYFKTAVFRYCPYCRSNLKLPHKKGKHSVRCPKCRQSFNVRIIL